VETRASDKQVNTKPCAEARANLTDVVAVLARARRHRRDDQRTAGPHGQHTHARVQPAGQ
jgi:hypothetical protein